MDFPCDLEFIVRDAAPRLVMASSDKPTLRILDDFGSLSSFWTHGDGWHDAREARRVS